MKIAKGLSYWHVNQEIGKCFIPNQLKGYYNDLTKKTIWNGLVDDNGIPLTQFDDGRVIYFPTTITQKALGHFDLFLVTSNEHHLAEFFKLCNWLVKNQDEKGGWKLEVYKDVTYSAMIQGEAISCLVRVYNLSEDEKFLKSADKALQLLLTPIEKGGCAWYDKDNIYLEEFPSKDRNTILNGWIFAIFGVYDYCLLTVRKEIKETFDKSILTLKRNLKYFDSGFWSYYDIKKNIASPFYHNLHINQFHALYLVTNDEVFRMYRERWESYKSKFINRNLALLIKVCQRLKNPPEIISR